MRISIEFHDKENPSGESESHYEKIELRLNGSCENSLANAFWSIMNAMLINKETVLEYMHGIAADTNSLRCDESTLAEYKGMVEYIEGEMKK